MSSQDPILPPTFWNYAPWETCKSKHFINGGIPGISTPKVAVYNVHTQEIKFVSKGNADPDKWTHISSPIHEDFSVSYKDIKKLSAEEMAIKALDDIPWILSNERLPPDEEIYELTVYQKDWQRTFITSGWHNLDFKKWSIFVREDYRHEVIAWRPLLSKPYQIHEENKENINQTVCEMKSCEEIECLQGVYHLDFQSIHWFCKKHHNELYLNLQPRDDNKVIFILQ